MVPVAEAEAGVVGVVIIRSPAESVRLPLVETMFRTKVASSDPAAPERVRFVIPRSAPRIKEAPVLCDWTMNWSDALFHRMRAP